MLSLASVVKEQATQRNNYRPIVGLGLMNNDYYKEETMQAGMDQLNTRGRLEFGPMLPPDSEEFHTRCRSTQGHTPRATCLWLN